MSVSRSSTWAEMQRQRWQCLSYGLLKVVLTRDRPAFAKCHFTPAHLACIGLIQQWRQHDWMAQLLAIKSYVHVASNSTEQAQGNTSSLSKHAFELHADAACMQQDLWRIMHAANVLMQHACSKMADSACM